MRIIVAVNIIMGLLIVGGIVFLVLDMMHNFSGRHDEKPEGPEQSAITLPAGAQIEEIETTNNQLILHVRIDGPADEDRLYILHPRTGEHKATVTLTRTQD